MNQSTQLRDLEEQTQIFTTMKASYFIYELNTQSISHSRLCVPQSFKPLCGFDAEKYWLV